MTTKANNLITASEQFEYLNNLNYCNEILLLKGLQIAFLFKSEFTKKPAPRISFVVKDCQVNFFETKEALTNDLKSIGIDTRNKTNASYKYLDSKYYNIYWKQILQEKNVIIEEDTIIKFAKQVDSTLKNSLHFHNIIHDYIKDLLLDFENFLDAENTKRSITLAKYIQNHFSPYFCCVLNLSPTDAGISKFVRINVLGADGIDRMCAALPTSKDDIKPGETHNSYKCEII